MTARGRAPLAKGGESASGTLYWQALEGGRTLGVARVRALASNGALPRRAACGGVVGYARRRVRRNSPLTPFRRPLCSRTLCR